MNTESTTAPNPPTPDNPNKGWFAKFLATVEWLGNLLPHPITLFALFCLFIVLFSGLAEWLGMSVPDPRPEGSAKRELDGMIQVNSLMSAEGLRWIVQSLVTNFTGFTPLGTVLVALLGVSVAEHSGMLSALMRSLVIGASKRMVTVMIVFAGVVSNTASELGYVVLIPMAALIFHSLGRHPLAGLAAALGDAADGAGTSPGAGAARGVCRGVRRVQCQFIDWYR